MSGPDKIPGGNPIIEALNRATVSDTNLDATEAKKIDAEWAKATPAEQQEAMRFIKAKCSSTAPVCATLKDYVTHRKEVDRNVALTAGLRDFLGKSQSGVSNMFGPGGPGTGIHDALGGIEQKDILGDVGGVGGLGTRGVGMGGGGSGLGADGIGLYGKGQPSSNKTGNLDLGGRGKGITRIDTQPAPPKGGLPKDVIGRIIRRHWAQIKHCYEKALAKNSDLSGKVVARFSIDPDGNAKNITLSCSDGMQNEQMLKEMKEVLSNIPYPKPKGGGLVDVTYPFIFTVAE